MNMARTYSMPFEGIRLRLALRESRMIRLPIIGDWKLGHDRLSVSIYRTSDGADVTAILKREIEAGSADAVAVAEYLASPVCTARYAKFLEEARRAGITATPPVESDRAALN